MARTRKNQTKVCSVTGLETSVNNFYANQTHVKAVDLSLIHISEPTRP